VVISKWSGTCGMLLPASAATAATAAVAAATAATAAVAAATAAVAAAWKLTHVWRFAANTTSGVHP